MGPQFAPAQLALKTKVLELWGYTCMQKSYQVLLPLTMYEAEYDVNARQQSSAWGGWVAIFTGLECKDNPHLLLCAQGPWTNKLAQG